MTAPASAPTGVTAIIATRGRPELLRRAVRSILDQDHAGPVEVVVVFDHVDIDPLDDVEVPSGRAVRTIVNARTPGLAGGRNSGVDAAAHELVAFCDDDDWWRPSKLRRQLEAWTDDPAAVLIATGIEIHSEGGVHARRPAELVTHGDFLASRVVEIHPSSFLVRAEDLRTGFGPVDEALPFGYGEDYDLLLRATRRGHVRAVPEPLVVVDWQRPSFFTARWEKMVGGLTYLLEQHPDFAQNPKGYALVASQLAFAHGALGQRADARRWARVAWRCDRRQLRTYAAFVVGYRLAPAGLLVRAVNATGRGL